MRKITMWTTCDGACHYTYEEAKRRAESRYGTALSKLSMLLGSLKGHQERCEFLADPENLERFIQLKKLFEDIQLEERGGNDD